MPALKSTQPIVKEGRVDQEPLKKGAPTSLGPWAGSGCRYDVGRQDGFDPPRAGAKTEAVKLLRDAKRARAEATTR
jgi:hypothetical protein